MSTYETNIPGAAGYASSSLLATNAYSNALARLNQKRMGSLRTHGYAADINPENGTIANLHVDANNPYGQYQQMLRGHADTAQAAQEQAQARGLHGGLANQLESDARYGFGGDAAAFGSQFQGELAGYQDEQTGAAYDRDNALWQAQHQAELEAIAAGAYNDGAPDETADPNDPNRWLDFSNATGATNNAVTNTGPLTKTGQKVITPTKAKVIAKASAAAMKKAGGKSTPTAALAARSAGMNALYAPAKKPLVYKGRH